MGAARRRAEASRYVRALASARGSRTPHTSPARAASPSGSDAHRGVFIFVPIGLAFPYDEPLRSTASWARPSVFPSRCPACAATPPPFGGQGGPSLRSRTRPIRARVVEPGREGAHDDRLWPACAEAPAAASDEEPYGQLDVRHTILRAEIPFAQSSPTTSMLTREGIVRLLEEAAIASTPSAASPPGLPAR